MELKTGFSVAPTVCPGRCRDLQVITELQSNDASVWKLAMRINYPPILRQHIPREGRDTTPPEIVCETHTYLTIFCAQGLLWSVQAAMPRLVAVRLCGRPFTVYIPVDLVVE